MSLKDFGTSTILTAPSPADSGTSLVVQAAHGVRFPATPFYVTVHPPFEFPTLDNAEKLLVTAKSTDTFTITRAQGDTTAKTIEAGWRISNSLFLGDIPDTFDDLTDGATNVAFTTTLKSKLDAIEASADVTDATNVDAAGATMNADTSLAGNGYFLDEDTLSSDSATKVASQQSIKAYIDSAITAAKAALMPIGTIVALGVSTDPATLYGFGTWTAITGRVLVGKAASGTFQTLDATGGAETHTLTSGEMPSHTHTQNAHTHTQNSHTHTTTTYFTGGGNGGLISAAAGSIVSGGATGINAATATNQNTTATNQNTGGDGAHNNLQPYIVKYIWQRTA